MKINSLEIDGYGVWSGLRVGRLSDGLNVVYGPNEAGKTTLLQFVRSVLYGFSPDRRRYFPPVHGGRPGGRIEVVGPNGRFQIDRHDSADGQAAGEQITVTAADGTRQGEHIIKLLLSNLDEAIFNNVFAIGLREIQELGTLGDTEAAQLLYNITAGLDRVSLVEVMRELETLRNHILDRSGGPCQVVQLMADRERLRQEIEELQSLAHRYGRLAAQRSHLERELTGLEEEKNRAEHRLRIIDLAIGLRDRWAQRAAMDAELISLGPQPPMPTDAVQRLDVMQDRLQKYQQRVARSNHQREAIRREGADLKVNASLARQAARIEALLEQEPWINTVQGQVASLDKEITELQAGLAAEHERLGLGRSADTATLPALSPRKIRRLASPARALQDCSVQLKQAQHDAATANDTAASLDRQIETALTARQETDLSAATDRAGNLVAQLRRRIQVDERLDQMTRYENELEEQSRHLLDHQVLPIWVVAGLGAVFVLGLVLIIAGLFMPTSMTHSLGWALALLGLVGVGAAVFGKIALERSNARQLDACRKQIHMLQLQIKQAKDERDVLDAQLPRGGGPLVSRLTAAEQDLAAIEELAPLDTRRSAARQDAAAVIQRAAQAEQQLRAARRRWRELLSEAGLPEDLTPRQVRRIARRSDQIQQIERRLSQRQEEIAQRRRELEMLVGRVSQLVTDCGVEVSAKEPIEQLRQLADARARQQAQLARREVIRRQLRQLRHQRARLEEGVRRLKHRRRELFREAHVEDEQEFRRRAVEAARANALQRDRDTIDREITAAIADRCSHEAIRQQLEGDAASGMEARRNEVHARLGALEDELRDRLEKRGQLAEQMRTLAEDRQLAQKQLDLVVIEKRLKDAIHRWQVLAVTCRILETIRTTYEHERQPETLREASGYLDRLTRGHYHRVWTPLGEQSLRVEDAEGRSLPVELLSRGTREQLFLSLRLALAAYYARHGAPLPLVLDDVLVNFDSERAKAATSVLRDFAAAGHQLLVFTCHEHIAKLFKTFKVPVSSLPDNAEKEPAPVLFEEPLKEKPKRERKSPPSSRKAPARAKPPEPEEEVEDETLEEEEEDAHDEGEDELFGDRESEDLEEVTPWEEGEDDDIEEETGDEDLWEEEDASDPVR